MLFPTDWVLRFKSNSLCKQTICMCHYFIEISKFDCRTSIIGIDRCRLFVVSLNWLTNPEKMNRLLSYSIWLTFCTSRIARPSLVTTDGRARDVGSDSISSVQPELTNGMIPVPSDTQLDFPPRENFTKSFANLKKSINRHLSNNTHTSNWQAWIVDSLRKQDM